MIIDVTISLNPIWFSSIAPMAFVMTPYAKGDNVQPVFFITAFVVIVLGLLFTISTSLGIGAGEFASPYRIHYGVTPPLFFLVIFSVAPLSIFALVRFPISVLPFPPLARCFVAFVPFFSFLGTSIMPLCDFSFIRLIIYSIAILTGILQPVFPSLVLIKFLYYFSFTTLSTNFLFNHLAPFKRKIKPLFGNVRQVPTASDDLTKEGLYSNNNVLVGKKQKSPYVVGFNNYTIKGAFL